MLLAFAFPFLSVHALICPFMSFQLLSCPFLFSPSMSLAFLVFSSHVIGVDRFPKSKIYISSLLNPYLENISHQASSKLGKGVARARVEPKKLIRRGVVVMKSVLQPFGGSFYFIVIARPFIGFNFPSSPLMSFNSFHALSL